MAKNGGYFLVEVLLGIFLLGIIAVSILPMIQGANNNFMILEKKIELAYLAESIIESMKAFNYDDYDEGYILDIKTINLINLLSNDDNVTILLPLDNYTNEFPYSVTINKISIDEKLWKIVIKVEQKSYKGRIKDVSYEAYMPKPEK